ncbi:uncharacterized protein BO66DRAFT_443785 [Aspergillus aculeatinus CBS 121060]|uniref:Uncharacterized protein n=1 Tax=Aspergillus aculeatinus CBS 121060 TaxID=1448322 RepID=A0ACD1GTT5_9EURO|nr:hypothetical protein BO66DRAFT_443785 [Aspergillus aculeatinus CBS 121060]RAH64609.1 hypothetical protein BO66DRAFT_443785 [Aspergillus aculeatinus CBS 121060]
MSMKSDRAPLNIILRKVDIVKQEHMYGARCKEGSSSELPSPRTWGGNIAASPITVRFNQNCWLIKQDIGFLDIDAQAQRDASSLWFNLTEARLAVDLAMTLSARRIDVLILTPYNAQVAKIKADLANRYHNATRKPRILTVDSSQGTEAESKRRVNVMTSRARQLVFYLGKWSYIQSATLQQSSRTLFGMLDHYSKHVPRFVIDPS